MRGKEGHLGVSSLIADQRRSGVMGGYEDGNSLPKYEPMKAPVLLFQKKKVFRAAILPSLIRQFGYGKAGHHHHGKQASYKHYHTDDQAHRCTPYSGTTSYDCEFDIHIAISLPILIRLKFSKLRLCASQKLSKYERLFRH